METRKPFWTWVFCDEFGIPSFSRVFTGLLVAFALGWVTRLVLKNNSLPDFAGLVIFIGTLYGINKASAALSKTQGPQGPTQ